MSVFGLPFFGAGIFLTLASLGVIPLTNEGAVSSFVWPVLVFMGLVFTAVGGTLVFGRSWTTLDSSQRVALKQWGLLVPMHAQTYRLDDYTAVVIGFKQGDSDTSDQFPVTLKSRSGADLLVSSSTQYAEARARAADVARHLHVDIEDATTDHPVRLTAGQADVPLQHRLRLDHAREEPIQRPTTARSQVTEELGAVQIVIPVRRLHPVVLGVMLLPLGIPLVIFGPLDLFFRQTHTPDAVSWFFLGFLILICGILPAHAALSAFLRSRRGRTIVSISTAGIRIEERGAWRTRTIAALDAADIMDVDYSTIDSMRSSARRTAEQHLLQSGRTLTGPLAVGKQTERVIDALSRFAEGGGITVKTRQGLTTFAQGLADEEIRYLDSVVRRALGNRLGR